MESAHVSGPVTHHMRQMIDRISDNTHVHMYIDTFDALFGWSLYYFTCMAMARTKTKSYL